MAKTFDVVMRFEMVAENTLAAVDLLKQREKQGLLLKESGIKFEAIRDDSLYGGSKDFASINIKGFVVLSSDEKHDLIDKIDRAVSAAGNGDTAEAEKLRDYLYQRFDYLSSRNLPRYVPD